MRYPFPPPSNGEEVLDQEYRANFTFCQMDTMAASRNLMSILGTDRRPPTPYPPPPPLPRDVARMQQQQQNLVFQTEDFHLSQSGFGTQHFVPPLQPLVSGLGIYNLHCQGEMGKEKKLLSPSIRAKMLTAKNDGLESAFAETALQHPDAYGSSGPLACFNNFHGQGEMGKENKLPSPSSEAKMLTAGKDGLDPAPVETMLQHPDAYGSGGPPPGFNLEAELRQNEMVWICEELPHPSDFEIFEDLSYEAPPGKAKPVNTKAEPIDIKPATGKRARSPSMSQPPKRYCVPPATYPLLETLLGWYNALDREEIPWRDIHGLQEPKNIPIVCVSFWATDMDPPKELMRISPGDVECIRYSEVTTYLKGVPGMDPYTVREANRNQYTPGPWTFITFTEQPRASLFASFFGSNAEDASTAVRPWHLIAFPSHTITSAAERVYDLNTGAVLADSEGNKSLYAFDAWGQPYPRLGSPASMLSSPGKRGKWQREVPRDLKTYVFPEPVFARLDREYDRTEPVYAASFASHSVNTTATTDGKYGSAEQTQQPYGIDFGPFASSKPQMQQNYYGRYDNNLFMHSSSPDMHHSFGKYDDRFMSSSPPAGASYTSPFMSSASTIPTSPASVTAAFAKSRSTYQAQDPFGLKIPSSPPQVPQATAYPTPATPALSPYLRRTILCANGMGSLPLVQTSFTDSKPWQQVIDAFGRGAGRIMIWTETEDGSLMSKGEGAGAEWVFKNERGL